jgi:hypothetical protein
MNRDRHVPGPGARGSGSLFSSVCSPGFSVDVLFCAGHAKLALSGPRGPLAA